MKEFIDNLKFAWSFSKNQKGKMFLFIFFSLIFIVVSILFPIYYAKIVVNITSNQYYQIFLVAILLLVLNLVNSLANFMTSYLSQKIYMSVITVIQVDLGREILKLNNKTLEDNGSGVFIERLTRDSNRLADIFNELISYLTTAMEYIGRFVAIFIVSKVMFIYMIISIIILYVVEKERVKKVNELDKVYRKKNEKKSGFISELVRGSRDIKMLNAEESFSLEFKNIIVDNNKSFFKKNMTSRKYNLLNSIIYDTTDFIMTLFLMFLLMEKYINVTKALILWNYSGGLLRCVRFFGSIMDRVKDFNLSSLRIREILDGDKFKKELFGSSHLDKVHGDFEFKNVSFGYGREKVLDNISFKINANETVAFVGKSGAGKSTIFSLITKMYDTNKGIIKIDGKNIKKLDKDTIRGNITIISQDPYIFNMSIRDNLRLVKENLTEEEMIEACRLACLEDYIESLPEKYDTMIGEGGINLSGGQKQRLAIARALVQKTEIILFDEATSALDNETQSKIQEAIDNMKDEYTILIIAHRLSTIINADRILFINDGKVEAEGTHKELLKSCKNYKELYESELINRK